ncbi:uncharacterized protein LOC120686682 isoform X1 [Panicum virgatum]|uniref:Uncharacterized protein n=1 Tax=Panicum virgatum TaxID=38727 RepID=A0A8T0P9D7_PANVG|nr:uncharacterized protein LOC120686682 isoform X1 [Panicum virgatum]KAG2557485.1 hypothetical protein PVAP13_8NG211300 [Panicum virgatum]
MFRWSVQVMERLERIRGRSKKMNSKIVGRTSLLVLLLIVLLGLLVCTEGGKEIANEKAHKVHPSAASENRAIGSRDMVKTNDYGRYDPSPAFSKPRFKLIPN